MGRAFYVAGTGLYGVLQCQAKTNIFPILVLTMPSTNIIDPSILRYKRISNMVVNMHDSSLGPNLNPTVLSLRKALISETVPLAKRFRALFSLKYLASQQPPTRETVEAIQAIAAAFSSPSALLKHELAYCLGQTKNLDAVPFLRQVLEDRNEDEMCRHEAAEALGALGDVSSVDLMRQLKDDKGEPTVVRETCEIAVDRILWEISESRMKERLKQRSAGVSSELSQLT